MDFIPLARPFLSQPDRLHKTLDTDFGELHACPTGDVPGADARRVRLRRGGGDRRLSPRPGRHPPLRLALPPGGQGEHARLRRPGPPQPNAELGGAEAHGRLCQALGEAGLGQILDIVPNHMSIASRENKWWWDVLENGQSSRYAAYFDVDWHPPEAEAPRHGPDADPGRPLRPGGRGRARSSSSATAGRSRSTTYDHVMPVAPRSLNDLLQRARPGGSARTCWRSSPTRSATCRSRRRPTVESVRRRHRDKEVLRSAPGPALLREPGGRPGHRRRDRRDQRLARARSTPSWSGRTTGWPTGGPPARSSTIAGSSTSTPWSACGWRTSGSSRTATG